MLGFLALELVVINVVIIGIVALARPADVIRITIPLPARRPRPAHPPKPCRRRPRHLVTAARAAPDPTGLVTRVFATTPGPGRCETDGGPGGTHAHGASHSIDCVSRTA